ncbi:MAG: CdaR family protein [bacterium]
MKDFFFKNIGLKIISLVMAVLLWFLVVGEQKSEITFRVPIELSNIPDKMEIVSELPEYADIKIIGSLSSIKGVTPTQVRVSAKLAGDKEVEYVPLLCDPPNEVKIVDITPNKIRIKLEKTNYKEVELEKNYEGTPLKGYKLKSIDLKPKKVTVAGPKSKIKILKSISTSPVDLNDRNSSFSAEIKPLVDKPFRLCNNDLKVVAKIELEETILTKKLNDVSITVSGSNFKKNVKFFGNDMVSVEIKGPENIVEKLSSKDINVFIEVGNLKTGTHSLPVKIDLVPQVSLVSYNPKKVKVVIK